MPKSAETAEVRAQFEALQARLSDQIKQWVAEQLQFRGHRWASFLAKVTGMKPEAVLACQQQPDARPPSVRKPLVAQDPQLLKVLERRLVPAPVGRGNFPLCWTLDSTRTLEAVLRKKDRSASYMTLDRLLNHMGCTLQLKRLSAVNRLRAEAQLWNIGQQVLAFQRELWPALAVEVRFFKRDPRVNGEDSRRSHGKQLEADGSNVELVSSEDNPKSRLSRVRPPGKDWTAAQLDEQIAMCATEAIRSWWEHTTKQGARRPQQIYVVVAGGVDRGGTRSKLWKTAVTTLQSKIGRRIKVSHMPIATNHWNQVEQRMRFRATISKYGEAVTRGEVIVEHVAKPAATGDNTPEPSARVCEHIKEVAKNTVWNYELP